MSKPISAGHDYIGHNYCIPCKAAHGFLRPPFACVRACVRGVAFVDRVECMRGLCLAEDLEIINNIAEDLEIDRSVRANKWHE